jgi:hypothetical protein
MSERMSKNVQANYAVWRFYKWLEGGKSYRQIDEEVASGVLKPEPISEITKRLDDAKDGPSCGSGAGSTKPG